MDFQERNKIIRL